MTTAPSPLQRNIANDQSKTPEQLAQDARQATDSAKQSASDVMNDVKAVGSSTVQALRPVAEDAKNVGRDALAKAKDIGADAKSVASDAVDSTKAAADKTLIGLQDSMASLKTKVSDLQEAGARYVGESPGKSLLMAFAGGVVLGALLTRQSRDLY